MAHSRSTLALQAAIRRIVTAMISKPVMLGRTAFGNWTARTDNNGS
jgi:hypothetical protein